MTDFIGLSQRIKTTIKARRNPITLVVHFKFPDEVRDTIPLSKICDTEGTLGMTFYIEPQVGDCLEWQGYLWMVKGRLIRPNKYQANGPRVLPVIAVEFLGECPDDSL